MEQVVTTVINTRRKIAPGDQLIEKSKEIQASVFNKQDRTVAMDMLGFIKQLVFAT